MARMANPEIKERNESLVAYFKRQVELVGTEDGPKFVPRDRELAAKFGMSLQMVQIVLREAGLVNNSSRRARLELQGQPKLSNFHSILGSELAKMVHALILEGAVKTNGVTELGLYLKMTPQRLTALFSGHADPTIGELIKITDACKVSVTELISRVKKKEQDYCLKKLSNTSNSTLNTGGSLRKPTDEQPFSR